MFISLKRNAVAILVVLVLVVSINCHESAQGLQPTETVLQDLETYLRYDVNLLQSSSAAAGSTWDSIISIQRRLDGKGFHRSLQLQIAPASTHSTRDLQGCVLSLLQPLPSSIFADPYQLKDLTRSAYSSGSHAAGYDYVFKLLGPLDLEL
jgi:hypothetical protein